MLPNATLLTALLLIVPAPSVMPLQAASPQTTASLESSSPKERIDAVEQLSRAGKNENVSQLDNALKKEPRSDVRAAIVAGLARIGGRDVVPILIASLRSDLDRDVRLQVVDSLQRLYIPIDNQGTLRTILNRVKSAFAEEDRPLVQNETSVDAGVKAALAEAMQKDFSQEVRAAAARALGSLKAKDQVAVLISTLELPQNREHPEVRLEIVQSLGMIRDPVAGPALERALRDSDKKISQEAILSIGLTGYKEARPLIENVFRTDTNRESKRKALESLALMRDSGSLPLFESLLGHPDDYYREMAAEGLARIDHDPNVLKTRYEQEKKTNVRNALAFALASADQDQYIDDLANALATRQEYQAKVYLFELGKFEGKLSQLHGYLRSPNPKVRASMARIIGDIGDPSSRQPIENLTKDNNTEVVAEAAAALRKITGR